MATTVTISCKPSRPPGHYVADFLDELHNVIIPRATSKQQHDDMVKFTAILERASPWVVNDVAAEFIKNTDMPNAILAGTRLPFGAMAVEWQDIFDLSAVMQYTHETGVTDRIPTDKRVILLQEVVGRDASAFGTPLQCIRDEMDAPEEEFRGIFLRSASDGFRALNQISLQQQGKTTGHDFVVNPIGVMITKKALADLSWIRTDKDRNITIDFADQGALHGDELDDIDKPYVLPSMEHFFHDWHSSNLNVPDQVVDLYTEIHVTLGLLGILTCDNVPVIERAPSRLKQQRRKKQKKRPLPTYRTLHISDHLTLPGKGHGGGGAGEVAPHWRRGHIRNQPTAKGPIKKWIAPQIIRADKLKGGTLSKPETVVT